MQSLTTSQDNGRPKILCRQWPIKTKNLITKRKKTRIENGVASLREAFWGDLLRKSSQAVLQVY